MKPNKILKILAIPVLLGIGGTSLAAQTGREISQTDAPLSCELAATTDSGMFAIKGIVKADAPARGTYRLEVKSAGGSGHTNITQGGGFTTDSQGAAELGNVMLGGSGSSYVVKLMVEADTRSAECTDTLDPQA